MREGWIGAGLAGALGLLLCLAGAGPLSAQQRSPTLQSDPNLNSEDQLAPSQIKQRVPAAVAEPTGGSQVSQQPVRHPVRTAAAPHPAAAAVPRGAHVVACSGVFAQQSNALRLALAYDYKNVVFADVSADGGTKVRASVIFPNNPKFRLEVWWSNPAESTGIYLIDIKDKSTWIGPQGMRLGLDLAQLEKLNRKPFKLKGFDKQGVATVSDWDGGALASLPGGCKSGVMLTANPKASADAVSAMPADKEFSSADPALRSVKPTVSEILIGY
jgi:hypothetical protein